jgi:hypothetical protein
MGEPNPRGKTPALHDGDLRERRSPQSLLESLGDTFDDIRQIASDLGARPYTYHSITVRWSGGSIGRGTPEVISDVAIVPTPEQKPLGYMDRLLTDGGTVERGGIVLDGISPRFTEDEIDELFGVESVEGQETFIEERIDSRDGKTRRRRYSLVKKPERKSSKWRVVLERADGERDRDGKVQFARKAIFR